MNASPMSGTPWLPGMTGGQLSTAPTAPNLGALGGLGGAGGMPGGLAGLLNNPAIQQLLMKSGNALMAPGATGFKGQMTPYGTPVPQSPHAMGPLSMMALQMGNGSLNQWPPTAGQAGQTPQIPWLAQQRQMNTAPPWMQQRGIQPINGSTY